MQKEDRFLEIRKFLNEFSFFHEKEMMEHYPHGFGKYEAWVDELMQFNRDELRRFDFYLDTNKIKEPSFLDFLQKAKKLMDLEEISSGDLVLSEKIRKKLTQKKEHEISKLTKFAQTLSFEKLIDVGGGIGHLAMAMVENLETEAICFDMDKNLQEAGRKKIKRWLPTLHGKIHFIPQKFEKETKLESHLKGKTLLTGLHACGPLSTYLVELATKENISYLINFGCCYHKLKDEYNLSKLASKTPLWFTKHALTVASKSNTLMQEKDLEDKYRVKKYRYALHFFLIQKGFFHFVKTGNTKKLDYQKGFSFFMRKFAGDYLDDDTTDEILNSFYFDEKTQTALERTIRAGLIRSILGRLIEIYIVLDRALYLEEKGLESQIFSFFNPKLSPRNILLFAKNSQP